MQKSGMWTGMTSATLECKGSRNIQQKANIRLKGLEEAWTRGSPPRWGLKEWSQQLTFIEHILYDPSSPVQRALHENPHLVLTTPYEVDNIILSILQMRKQAHSK